MANTYLLGAILFVLVCFGFFIIFLIIEGQHPSEKKTSAPVRYESKAWSITKGIMAFVIMGIIIAASIALL